jgi:hypothetical protein
VYNICIKVTFKRNISQLLTFLFGVNDFNFIKNLSLHSKLYLARDAMARKMECV